MWHLTDLSALPASIPIDLKITFESPIHLLTLAPNGFLLNYLVKIELNTAGIRLS